MTEDDEISKYEKSAISLLHAESYTECIECCDALLALDAENIAAYEIKHVALYTLGRHREAIKCNDARLNIILDADPHNEMALANKGDGLVKLGYYESAIACYTAILDNNPDDFPSLLNKGRSLCELGRYAEAIKYLKKIVDACPISDAMVLYARACKMLGQYKHAMKLCNDVLALDDKEDYTDALREKISIYETVCPPLHNDKNIDFETYMHYKSI